MNLYSDQQRLYDAIKLERKNGARNVVAVLPTGGGKTRIFCHDLEQFQGNSVAMAHRQELVGQMSLTLAEHGIRHRILAADATVKEIIQAHVKQLGRSFFHPNADTTCASVDTILARKSSLTRWLSSIGLFVNDEGHHVLAGNKWGEVCNLFTNAIGLLPTACPHRADKLGLGRHAAGIADAMVVGAEMRELIDLGRLCDFLIYAPAPSIDAKRLKVGSTGDYTQNSVIAESRRQAPRIVGDCVAHYLKHTPGARGMTFTTDIVTAREIAAAFNAAGIPALAASSKCPPGTRQRLVSGLRDGSLLMGVNVDLFGEGTDIPALEMIMQGARTASLNKFRQQAGRPLRKDPKNPLKTHGVIVDMVGNVIEEHGPPDRYIKWTLDGRSAQDAAEGEDDEALRACTNPSCGLVYPRVLAACKWCGHRPVPVERRSIEQVDGEVYLLDPDVLARMRGHAEYAHRSPEVVMGEMTVKHAPLVAVKTAVARQRESLAALATLNESIAWWVGRRRAKGVSDEQSHRELYLRFKTNIFDAQCLSVTEALNLAERLDNA